jgi:acetyltransferase-like isoleucine patch superfamily enzyme
MDKTVEAKQSSSFRRAKNKLLQILAKSAFVPNNIRARFQKMRGVKFTNVKTVFLGENVTIDELYPENITIGNRCIITDGCKILSHYIDTEKLSDNPDFYFRFYQGKVIIEDDVFIGYNSIIAKPVIIGKGSIIGANTVITKDVPAGAVMVSAPAMNIKKN